MATLQTVAFAPVPNVTLYANKREVAQEQDAGPSTATLSSINAQLISHGWAKRPLNLSKLPEKDHAEVVTVLFELLGSSVVGSTFLGEGYTLTVVQPEQL
jgi:hypothetical protein